MIDAAPLEREIARLASLARLDAGAGSLEWDATLAQAAREHSRAMAEARFFSHTSPLPGRAAPMDRVAACGGEFDGVGENIAVHGEEAATANDFVDGWMSSPGHRRNLLEPIWSVTGVGVFVDAAASSVFATQLFGVPSALKLRQPRLEALATTWYQVQARVVVGRDHDLAAFVANRFAAHVAANAGGTASLEVEVPWPGRTQVVFGRRRRGSESGWIVVHEGIAHITQQGEGTWHSGQSHGDVLVLAQGLYRVRGSTLRVGLSGETLCGITVVLDGSVERELGSGQFDISLELRGGSGHHTIDLGRPTGGTQYEVLKRLILDADAGTLEIARTRRD